jgi:hypothetical protein
MDTVRFRRVAGAVSLVLGPALLVAASVVLPWSADDDTAASLGAVARNVTATQFGDLLAFLGILVMIPALLAIMRVLRTAAPVLSLVGGSLAIAGFVGAMLLVVSDQYNIGLGESAKARTEIAAALDGSSAWVINLVLVVFLLGMLVGTIVLGVGLLRARLTPAWAGGALIVGPALSVAAHAADVKGLDIVAGFIQLAGFAAVARVVWSTSDRGWDVGEMVTPPPRTGDAVAPAG